MSNRRRRRKSPLPFLLLNIIISAATTLLVLWLWNRAHQAEQNFSVDPQVQLQTLQAQLSASPSPAPPLPATEHPVIQIENVFGLGDLENEVVVIRRVGDEQEIWLNDWVIQDADGNSYLFNALVLNKDAEVQLYTKAGYDTVNILYWGLNKSIWQSGETVKLIDSAGNIRATFDIP